MKRLLSSLFVTVFLATVLFSVISGSAATETWRRMTYISAGETYLLAVPGITDTKTSFSSCVLKSVQSADPHGLDYCERSTGGNFSNDCLWTVESASGGYYLKSVATGKYLNMKPAAASDGEGKGYATMETAPQVLNLILSGGKVKISASLGGVTYYVRFTNTYRSAASGVSCWEAGTADGSNQFEIYGKAGAETEYKNTTEPLFTVACFADPHIDYGIQSWPTPIRVSTVTSAQYVRNTIGAADVVLVGGDITSQNDTKAAWNNNLINKSRDTVYDTFSIASKDGKVMLITGNHDNEAGVASGDTIHSGDYDKYMTENIGPFTASLRFNDMGKGKSKYNELLCYRYTVGKMEFIGINTPYRSVRSNGHIYLAQIEWVESQLKAIGKEKTVIIQCHYPIEYIDTAPGDTSGAAQKKLRSVLEAFPNVIYTYGHVHGDDYKYAWYTTSELVVPQGSVTKLSDNSYKTDAYITCHMGSMGYYLNQFNNYKYLSAAEPGINQLLMIEFYIDHITFRYYNTGEKVAVAGVREIASFTVARDMSLQLEELKNGANTDSAANPSGSVTDTGTGSDRNTSTDLSTGSNSSGSAVNGSDYSDPSGKNDSTDLTDSGTTDNGNSFVPPVIDTEVNATTPETNALAGNIAGTADQLMQTVLTDYEQQWAADGDQAKIWLTVTDVAETVDPAVKERIQNGGKGTVGAWLELTLFSQMEGESQTQVPQTNGNITVTLTVPESLRKAADGYQRSFSVLRAETDSASVLPVLYDSVSGILTFETDLFSSVYALAYEDIEAPVADSGTDGISTDPAGSVTDTADSDAPVLSSDKDVADKGGLSVGAIVAIVGGAVILLGAGGFCLWYFVLRKKKPSNTPSDS